MDPQSNSRRILETSNLKKIYHQFLQPKINALDGVTFSIDKGETVAFLGPNGAGKTTTIKIILGLLKPDSGTVKIFDRDPKDHTVRKDIGYLPENPSFYRFLTGKENLRFLSHLIDHTITEERLNEILEMVNMAEVKDRPINGYSRGMIQRLGIAQAVVHDPELLVLDEPLSGLDPIGRRDIREILISMKNNGKAIFFSTHILPDVETIADRVLVIDKGKIIATTRIDELKDLEEFLIGILE